MNGLVGCVRCVVHAQTAGRYIDDLPLPPAVVVYQGLSLCLSHFNTDRGHPADYGRRP